jgi:hypothetical protein
MSDDKGRSDAMFELDAEAEEELLESIAEADRGELIPAEEVSAKLRAHYDFSGGVRGKYAARYAERPNVVVDAPDTPAKKRPRRSRVAAALRAATPARAPAPH